MRLTVASSVRVVLLGLWKRSSACGQTDRPRPISPHGVSKLTGENLVNASGASHGLPAISLRFFTVYGPRQRPDMAFDRLIRASSVAEPIQLQEDVVNVGNGSSVTINEILDYLSEEIGRPIQIVRLPRRRGDVSHTAAATYCARATLGWNPSTNWRVGLRRQVTWQVERVFTSNGTQSCP